MSQDRERRLARRNKHARTHHVVSEMECAMIIEHGHQVLDDAAPVPSNALHRTQCGQRFTTHEIVSRLVQS